MYTIIISIFRVGSIQNLKKSIIKKNKTIIFNTNITLELFSKITNPGILYFAKT